MEACVIYFIIHSIRNNYRYFIGKKMNRKALKPRICYLRPVLNKHNLRETKPKQLRSAIKAPLFVKRPSSAAVVVAAFLHWHAPFATNSPLFRAHIFTFTSCNGFIKGLHKQDGPTQTADVRARKNNICDSIP